MAEGKIVAIWGSPNSGKTTFATKLAAAIYDNYNSRVAVLYTDIETPVISVLFPNEKSENLGSVGIPLSKVDIDTEDILRNAVSLKARGNLYFIGYRAGENKYTYPRYSRTKAVELIEKIRSDVDYLIIDTVSNLENNILASTAIETANQTIRLASPDLKSISFYLSQLPVYSDEKYRLNEHIQGLNIPNTDVFMPVEEIKSHLRDIRFTVPYSRAVKLQNQTGTLFEATKDRVFEKRMKDIAEKVVNYEAE